MDDIEALGMSAIPSLGTGMWHEVANAVTPGLNETANDNIKNFKSMAYTLNQKYFDQVTKRYAGRKGVLAWELGNGEWGTLTCLVNDVIGIVFHAMFYAALCGLSVLVWLQF